jgi:hypothetical protein
MRGCRRRGCEGSVPRHSRSVPRRSRSVPRPARGERAARHCGKPELGSVRGRFHKLRLAGRPPQPHLLPARRGEGVKRRASLTVCGAAGAGGVIYCVPCRSRSVPRRGRSVPRPARGERAARHCEKTNFGSVRGRFDRLRLAEGPPQPTFSPHAGRRSERLCVPYGMRGCRRRGCEGSVPCRSRGVPRPARGERAARQCGKPKFGPGEGAFRQAQTRRGAPSTHLLPARGEKE